MDRLTSILVGVDFSAGSRAALAQAVRLGAWNRAGVRAFHVLDTLVMADLEFAMAAFQADVRAGMVEDVKREWARFAATVPGAEGVRFDVELGHPVMTLLDKVKEVKPDLLVMGMVGTTPGATAMGAGNTASAAVRRAHAKTLLVRDTHTGPFKTVVVGVDFSPTSFSALEQGVRMATQDSATLHIVHVFAAPWHRLHYRAPTPQSGEEYRDQYVQALERRLESFCEPLKHELNYLKPVQKLVDDPSHGAGLTQYVRSILADLVVVGTRGRTNIRDLLMGSTAERVVREAPCSILAVKPEEV